MLQARLLSSRTIVQCVPLGGRNVSGLRVPAMRPSGSGVVVQDLCAGVPPSLASRSPHPFPFPPVWGEGEFTPSCAQARHEVDAPSPFSTTSGVGKSWGWGVSAGAFALASLLAALSGCGPGTADPATDSGGDSAVEAEPVDDAGDEADSRLSEASTEPDADDAGAVDVDEASAETDVSAPDADDTPDGLAEAELDSTLSDQGSEASPYPPLCSDSYRDPSTEGCDDGLADALLGNARACNVLCQVVDRIVAGPSASAFRTNGFGNTDVAERWLGRGVHPVAGNAVGNATVWTELETADAGGEVRVGIATFDGNGIRQGVGGFEDVPFDAEPVVAALPDGTFAVAFNSASVDGDGLGIALARVNADGTIAGDPIPANSTVSFEQHSPDIVWTGSKLVVAWEDESAIPRRLCWRSFSATLVPSSSETCWAPNEAWGSSVALEPFAGDAVRSWREERTGDAGAYAVVVVANAGYSWTSPDLGLPSDDVTSAMAAIDSSHLLVVTTDAYGAMAATVLDDALSSVDEVTLSGGGRFTPTVAVTADGIYVAWRESSQLLDSGVGWDPAYEDVWVQKLSWDGYELDASAEPILLPSESSLSIGDQRRPTLAAVPYQSGGAMVAAWEDLTPDNYADECEHGDVIATLIPTPIVRGGQ